MDSYVISVKHPTGWMQLVVPNWFDKASMKNIRLVFNLIMQNSWDNAATITELDSFFISRPNELKDEWSQASRNYQNGYRLPDRSFHPEMTLKDVKAIELANRKLLNAVKKAKTRYEKMCEVKALYENLKKKNLIA